MKPTVQKLADSMAALDPAYKEQRSLINEQIEGLGAASDVRRQRLEGVRVNAFEQINTQARGRGGAVALGGIPLHEQAEYTADVFLPGMQDIEMQEGAERMQLRGQLADLRSQQSTAALSRIDQQQQALNTWNLQQAQIEAQRREAELNRKFQRSERIAGQEFTAGQNAANRAVQMAGQTQQAAKAPTSVALTELFKGYKPQYAGGQKYYTEDYIIPTLMDQQGLSRKQAESAVYNYRQRVFGEGR